MWDHTAAVATSGRLRQIHGEFKANLSYPRSANNVSQKYIERLVLRTNSPPTHTPR